MMQELTTRLRQAGLNIFRHRRGMLFVAPIRARIFSHESAGVSTSINAILEKVKATPGITRKQLAEQLAPTGAEPVDLERAKLTLASDLHWLVSEGYVIEFNDNSLDLPRAKPPVAPAAENSAAVTEVKPSEPIPEKQPVEESKDEPAEPVQMAVAALKEEPKAISLGSDSSPAS
jgi:hypothetical protein